MHTLSNLVSSSSLAIVRAADTGTGTGETPAFGDAATNSNVAVKPIAAPSRKRAAKPAKAAKPGKPAKRTAAKTTEPETDKRTERAERIAAERSDVNALYAHFEANRDSVPVKPLSAFKPLATTAHPIPRRPSVRQAAAICAALSGAGVKLANGAKAPRVFEHKNVRVCVENGVLRDAVSSGLISVSGNSPETEIITVRKADSISGLIGSKLLKAAKL